MSKDQHWETVYEDCLDLIAKLPVLAAMIYRNLYHAGRQREPDAKLDWAANLAAMMGLSADSPVATDLLRLYLLIHAGAHLCLELACAACNAVLHHEVGSCAG